MDIATLIGIVVGLGAIGGSIFLAAAEAGASTAGFVSPASFAIVFGGMLASVSVAFPLSDVLKLGAAMGAVLKGGEIKLGSVVDEAVEAAEVGRKGAADLDSAHLAKMFVIFRDSATGKWQVGVYENEGKGWLVKEELPASMASKHHIYNMKFNAKMFCYRASIFNILLPRTITRNVFLINPVLHVRTRNIMPFFNQSRCRYATINSA